MELFPTRRKMFLPHTVTLQRLPLILLFLSGVVNIWISELARLLRERGTTRKSSFQVSWAEARCQIKDLGEEYNSWWDGEGRLARFKVQICRQRATSFNNTIFTYELGVLVLSCDTGPWGEMGNPPPFCTQGCQAGPKASRTAQATRASLPGSSRTHWHALEAHCRLGSPQGHHAISCREDACICIA